MRWFGTARAHHWHRGQRPDAVCDRRRGIRQLQAHPRPHRQRRCTHSAGDRHLRQHLVGFVSGGYTEWSFAPNWSFVSEFLYMGFRRPTWPGETYLQGLVPRHRLRIWPRQLVPVPGPVLEDRISLRRLPERSGSALRHCATICAAVRLLDNRKFAQTIRSELVGASTGSSAGSRSPRATDRG